MRYAKATPAKAACAVPAPMNARPRSTTKTPIKEQSPPTKAAARSERCMKSYASRSSMDGQRAPKFHHSSGCCERSEDHDLGECSGLLVGTSVGYTRPALHGKTDGLVVVVIGLSVGNLEPRICAVLESAAA